MDSLKELTQEYTRLKNLASTVDAHELEVIMERINSYELYYKRELLMDSIIIYSPHGNKVNPHYG